MRRKFVKHSKFSAISNDNAVACLPYCQKVELCLNRLPGLSSYMETSPAASILSSSLVGGENKQVTGSSVPPEVVVGTNF